MILHGIEYQRPTSLNMRILADHVTYWLVGWLVIEVEYLYSAFSKV